MTLSSILFGQRFQPFGDFPSGFGNPGDHCSYPFTQLFFTLPSMGLTFSLSSSSSFLRHDCLFKSLFFFLSLFEVQRENGVPFSELDQLSIGFCHLRLNDFNHLVAKRHVLYVQRF